jgi:ACR3 family arsenite efflux pump ArsB
VQILYYLHSLKPHQKVSTFHTFLTFYIIITIFLNLPPQFHYHVASPFLLLLLPLLNNAQSTCPITDKHFPREWIWLESNLTIELVSYFLLLSLLFVYLCSHKEKINHFFLGIFLCAIWCMPFWLYTYSLCYKSI